MEDLETRKQRSKIRAACLRALERRQSLIVYVTLYLVVCATAVWRDWVSIENVLGYTAGGLSWLKNIPQILQNYRFHKTVDVSFETQLMGALSNLVFVAYAVSKSELDLPLMNSCLFSTLTYFTIVAQKLYYEME